MERFNERKFLLVVINTTQAITILLMMGLLVFIAKEEEAAQISTFSFPDLSCLVEKDSVDWIRVLMDLMGVGFIPLLVWLSSKTPDGWDGVCRAPWGEEESSRDGLWQFGDV
jgi:hypothetical protein